MKSFDYAGNFFPNQNGSKDPLSKRQLTVLRSLKNYKSPNSKIITVSICNHPQLTPTNDYLLHCSHNTGSPHTTKITGEKII